MINFDLTDEQLLLEQSVREWAAREVAPHIKESDRQHRFDPRLLPQMAELGSARVSASRPSTAAPGWTTSRSVWPAKSSSTWTRRCA